MAEVRLSFLLAAAALVLAGATGRLHFLVRECRSTSRRIAAILLLTGILALTVFYPLATVGSMGNLEVESLQLFELFAGHIVIAVFLGVWWLLADRPPLRRYLVWPRRNLREILRAGFVAGCVGWAFTIAGTGLIASAASLVEHAPMPPAEPPEIMLWLARLPVLHKLLVVGVAMTVEEAFFRAFLQTRLGLMPSSLLFAVAHFSYGLPYLVVGVLTISLVLGMVFRRTGHVLSCIVAHGVFDGIQLFLILPILVELAT